MSQAMEMRGEFFFPAYGALSQNQLLGDVLLYRDSCITSCKSDRM